MSTSQLDPAFDPSEITAEYWTVDGQPLVTYAWGIQTVGGARYNVPTLRGDDVQIPYLPGEGWVPKLPAARALGLRMWLWGRDPNSGDAVDDPRLAWNDQWAYLRRLLWQPERQFVLGRRWWRTDPTTGGPGVEYAEALGQLTNGLDPTMKQRTLSEFEVDIKLADPFFYGPTITTAPITVGAPTVSVLHPGDYTAFARGANVQVDFVGPLTAPRLVNTTRSPVVACSLPGSVAVGETVTLDVTEFVATSVTGSTVRYRTGEIINSGARSWQMLFTGTNGFVLQGSGAGHAVVRFRPPYL